MTPATMALAGALFGAVGPVLWMLAYRHGHVLADGSHVLERIAWIFPCAILFLGFPRADLDHPRDMAAAFLTGLVANMALCALIAWLGYLLWRRAVAG